MDDLITDQAILTTSGLTKEETKQLLIKAGWPEKLVINYLDRTFKQLDKGSLLRAHGVSKSFGESKILDDINFDIKSGEIFGLIGMSGAGKTTLLNVLVGVLKPEQGDVLLAYKDGTTQSVFRTPQEVRKRIGFATQTPSFYEKLTVRENLEHFGRLYRIKEQELNRRINSLLDLVGLKQAKDALSSNLSGGMQKRLDIACALLNEPDVLVLDEPTADLDPILRKQLWELIRQINLKGTTILLASHFLAEIELLCTRIAILQNKKIIQLGTAEELRNLYSHNYEIYLETITKEYDSILNELKYRKKYFSEAKQEGTELIITTPYPENILSVISAHAQKHKDIQTLHLSRPSLGKVFETLVKR